MDKETAIKIKMFMWSKGLKQSNVAFHLGLSRSTISYFLQGKIKSARLEEYFKKLMEEEK